MATTKKTSKTTKTKTPKSSNTTSAKQATSILKANLTPISTEQLETASDKAQGEFRAAQLELTRAKTQAVKAQAAQEWGRAAVAEQKAENTLIDLEMAQVEAQAKGLQLQARQAALPGLEHTIEMAQIKSQVQGVALEGAKLDLEFAEKGLQAHRESLQIKYQAQLLDTQQLKASLGSGDTIDAEYS